MSIAEFMLVGLAAVAGGLVNALAGGGTLITFPMLTATGVPAIAANVTNTVALCPGYLGATFAQLRDLRGQERRLLLLLPAGLVGGLSGGVLLINTGEHTFRMMVPFLILLATFLLAVQEPLKRWIFFRNAKSSPGGWAAVPMVPAAVYGGYFGAGVSVIVLAVLGLALDDSLSRLNALKQAVSLSINVAAAIFLVFSGQVVWPVALVMALGALAGGVLGGRLARWIKPATLRRIVVAFGVVVAFLYFLR